MIWPTPLVLTLYQWFLTWVWSNPRGWMSKFQGLGGKRFWAIKVKKKFSTHILFFQLRRVRWMHAWNLWGSVPPTRLRTTALAPRTLVVFAVKYDTLSQVSHTNFRFAGTAKLYLIVVFPEFDIPAYVLQDWCTGANAWLFYVYRYIYIYAWLFFYIYREAVPYTWLFYVYRFAHFFIPYEWFIYA